MGTAGEAGLKLVACRSCEGHVTPVLSLGSMPLANALVPPTEVDRADPRYPLDVVLCTSCSLVQIAEAVSPELLFRDYRYFSSFSDGRVAQARELAGRMADRLALGPPHLAAEIGSNDGYLLHSYAERKIPVLGIEPARNIARVAVERGVRTIAEFFTASLARRLVADGLRAEILHANNVLAHVPDVLDLVSGVAEFLAHGGLFVTESPHVIQLVEQVEFDTIYHEHVFYWSLSAQAHLFRRQGLQIVDVERLSIHGGSLRVFVRHEGTAQPTAAVERLLEEEQKWGVSDPRSYEKLVSRASHLREELTTLLGQLKAQGKSIAAYGAAAKGTTLLNHFGIGAETIDFVADRSPAKQGMLMPGVRIPIVSPDDLLRRKPDYCLLLTWNFEDEILAQQRDYRAAGGRFIVPIPEVRFA